MNRKSIQRLLLAGIISTALLLLPFGRPDVGAAQQSAEALPDYSEYKAEWREMGIPEDHIEAMIRQIPAVKASAVLDEILHASRDLEQHRLYPDDFAGRFVDDQGELHVLCTKGSSGKYAEILKDFPTVHIEEVEHAYNDLYQYALDQLSEDIPSAYVDQVNNGLCIELTPEAYKDKMSDQELEQVRQLEDGRAIPVVFKEAAPYAAASELWSGDSISGNGYQ